VASLGIIIAEPMTSEVGRFSCSAKFHRLRRDQGGCSWDSIFLDEKRRILKRFVTVRDEPSGFVLRSGFFALGPLSGCGLPPYWQHFRQSTRSSRAWILRRSQEPQEKQPSRRRESDCTRFMGDRFLLIGYCPCKTPKVTCCGLSSRIPFSTRLFFHRDLLLTPYQHC